MDAPIEAETLIEAIIPTAIVAEGKNPLPHKSESKPTATPEVTESKMTILPSTKILWKTRCQECF